jgi:hypothetical protein
MRKVLFIILFLFLIIPAIAETINGWVYDIDTKDYNLKFAVPDSWQEVNVNKLNTDICKEIIVKAFRPTPNSTFLILAQKIDTYFPLEDYLEALNNAFADVLVRKLESGIVKYKNLRFAKFIVQGQGKGDTLFLEEGNIPTIRCIYLAVGKDYILQFVLTCPVSEYDNLKDLMDIVLNSVSFFRKN